MPSSVRPFAQRGAEGDIIFLHLCPQSAELVKPFVDVWRLSLQRCLAKAAMFDDPTIYSDLVGRFVSLLGKVNEQCESFVALEDEDDGALDFPPFDQSGAPR